MAHYVASINMFEHPERDTVTVSLKVFRVHDFGARPVRPTWARALTVGSSTEWSPDRWLQSVLERLTAAEM